jgi:hypothetical protein
MADDEDYIIPRTERDRQHIVFEVPIRFDIHNVGLDFSLTDAVNWIKEALEAGLRNKDMRDTFTISADTAKFISRPDCKCYPEE